MWQGYSYKIFASKQDNRRPAESQRQRRTKFFYFNFPYISDKIDRKLRNIFRKNNLNVKLYRKSNTLRNYLKPPQPIVACKLSNCQLNNKFCKTRNCVYQLTCSKCDSKYIGSTIRELHLRYKEHTTNPNSSVYKHQASCEATFTVKILRREPDHIKLRFKESIDIANLAPTINSKLECEELTQLTY